MDKLEQAALDYKNNGYAIIRDVVPAELVAEAARHVEWLIAKYPQLRPEHLHHPLARHDAFWTRMILEPALVDVAEKFLGPDVACFTAHYICKPPYDGQAVLWHQDGAYWKLDPLEALTVWLAVDESTVENGCLRIIPGTQHTPIYRKSRREDVPNLLFSASDESVVEELIEEHGVVEIELGPGDVSIHHPNTVHCSEPNTSSKRRCGLDLGYISATTRIMAEGVYLDPLLVRGRPLPGVNKYAPIPEYREGDTIPFEGCDTWNERAKVLNRISGAADHGDEQTPVEAAIHMVSRLREDTTAR